MSRNEPKQAQNSSAVGGQVIEVTSYRSKHNAPITYSSMPYTYRFLSKHVFPGLKSCRREITIRYDANDLSASEGKVLEEIARRFKQIESITLDLVDAPSSNTVVLSDNVDFLSSERFPHLSELDIALPMTDEFVKKLLKTVGKQLKELALNSDALVSDNFLDSYLSAELHTLSLTRIKKWKALKNLPVELKNLNLHMVKDSSVSALNEFLRLRLLSCKINIVSSWEEKAEEMLKMKQEKQRWDERIKAAENNRSSCFIVPTRNRWFDRRHLKLLRSNNLATCLETLTITQCSQIKKYDFVPLKELKNLRNLTISETSLSSLDHLPKSLRHLHAGNCVKLTLQPTSDLFKKLPNLICADFCFCDNINATEMLRFLIKEAGNHNKNEWKFCLYRGDESMKNAIETIGLQMDVLKDENKNVRKVNGIPLHRGVSHGNCNIPSNLSLLLFSHDFDDQHNSS